MQRKAEFILLLFCGILCVNGQFILDRECDPELFHGTFNIEQVSTSYIPYDDETWRINCLSPGLYSGDLGGMTMETNSKGISKIN